MYASLFIKWTSRNISAAGYLSSTISQRRRRSAKTFNLKVSFHKILTIVHPLTITKFGSCFLHDLVNLVLQGPVNKFSYKIMYIISISVIVVKPAHARFVGEPPACFTKFQFSIQFQ